MSSDAAGKVHHFHTHPVDEILTIISGRFKFMWQGGERICGAGDKILLPAGTLHQSEALEGGAICAIATRPPAAAGAWKWFGVTTTYGPGSARTRGVRPTRSPRSVAAAPT